ncbi:MAG: DUF4159 domain-containing protein [Alphaproteobacteria bacterium]|nr:DUF4159 domain-containing protein [Alphaproteobacteria bacterium]
MIDLFSNMVFLHPVLLAGLLALPVLWYILRVTPPAPRSVTFPATRFLAGLVSEERSPRHTPWWILLLRLLTAALVILALAGPVYNPAQGLRGSGPVRLVMDNGWATAQVWDLEQKAAEELIAQAGREARAVYILTTAPAQGEKAPQAFGPLTASQALPILRGLTPVPWPSDYKEAAALAEKTSVSGSLTTFWFSDGLDEGDLFAFAKVLQGQGTLHYIAPPPARLPLLLRPARDVVDQTPSAKKDSGIRIAVDATRSIPQGLPAVVQALGENNAVLDIQTLTLNPSTLPGMMSFDLPPALQNQLSAFRLSGLTSAGGILLGDDTMCKRSVGIAGPAEQTETRPLVGPAYYLKRAMEPFAILNVGEIDTLLKQKPSMIVLPDIGAMPGETLELLENWVKKGGLLVRFAGPRMSEADGQPYLSPVRLRAGERSLAGSLSWEAPQKIAPFPKESPFFGISIPEDVSVTQQVLADPAQDLDGKVWARLEDGTPLITGAPLGRGVVVLVHTSADPAWSDLALSGLYVDLLKRLTRMAGQSGAGASHQNYAALDPILVLDGHGNLEPPKGFVHPLPAPAAESFVPDSTHPPGLYGREGLHYALNLGTNLPHLKYGANSLPADVVHGVYEARYEMDLMPYLLCAAFALFLLDWAIMIALMSGITFSLRPFARAASVLVLFALPHHAWAQEAASSSMQYSEGFYLAYVRTSDPALNAATREGLEALSQILNTRTSVEPQGVAEVDPEIDTLAFFPILYWAVDPGQEPLSGKALQNIQFYLDHGGTILFDTRDADVNDGSGYSNTQQAQALRRITATLSIPPLIPAPEGHVLHKSFYLLETWPGRYDKGTVWVEQQSETGRDGVSSVIIGGNDWAGAWADGARSGAGQPLVGRVMSPGTRQQELAQRFGVNLVMYALTGNYKADQVHMTEILKRLGK